MKLLPKNAASRVFGAFTRLHIPFLSKIARNAFANYYKLDMSEAEYPLSHYRNLSELFIRRLKPGMRPVADAEIVSPVDGVLSQTGTFDGDEQTLIQAKGKTYSLKSLLRSEELVERFKGGAFATIYLAPFNYHRIHSPVKGDLVLSSYCPGTLWPVNAGSVERVEGLFCINERLTSQIRLEDGSEVLVVKVGATNVGRIGVVYSDTLLTNADKLPRDNKRMDWIPN
jgi:phosphatidylserine decarboxylase